MINLLQKLSQKKGKPIFRKTTLTNDDLLHLDRKLDDLLLAKDDYLYRIKERFSKINPSNPRVSLQYLTEISEIPKAFLETFQPYKELRSSQ